ncbi:sigma-70 family RNA polymerase sigma factor [Stutzerimonas kirkiae]|uniref:RNA polymerase subunit sigma n=1 Tax=Stutzerimonas kirkiae TaxID=2211392 RepID=A0A4Q9R8L5_9GAMM|nr:sigma-70 family RNA polymerase sigma factor [Stutzerimonas kirkiae]TBU96269.1 RNA polymerase subunit sigma [Stutzerimonas kirkiae]TBV03388.1 RNA polymerase subunit sigma [Stutzerimonas kirkiae]TBV05845.1 RNA polymerase subunit sigma [Stutzerimonas kirkiae]TBV12909.1 RNA polymerase subunit sigma [Stutzerimonas kirkiae]
MSSDDPALHSAVTSLYTEHHRWLKGWLRKRLGSASDADDVSQDTFLRIIRKRNALDIREPRHYLSVVAKGIMLDLFRRRTLEQSYQEVLASLPEAQVPSLEEQALLFEALMEIDRMLEGLGPRVRQVFILSQVEGLTYARIAGELGISLRTVNNHMAKAMEHCCLMRLGL